MEQLCVARFPKCTRHLLEPIEFVDDLGTGNYGQYVDGVIRISALGIERLGLLKILAHELAHKYCEHQRLKNDNRFLKEFAMGDSDYIYYLAKRRFKDRWVYARSIKESFAYAFSMHVIGSKSTRFRQAYFNTWFPLEEYKW